jgi:hypothetical protein
MKKQISGFKYILMSGVLIWATSCEDSIITSVDEVNSTGYEVSEPFSYVLSLTDQSGIEMQSTNGSVTILTRENLDSLKITGKRRVRSESTEDAQEHLELLKVNIFEGNETIFISTEQPSQSHGRTYLVDYVIEMPIKWNVQISQINGNFDIATVIGDLNTELTNGNITLHKVYGTVRTQLVNGIISATVVVPDSGYCHLNNVNGQILLTIPDTTSALFHASVVNGSVAVHNLVITQMQSSPKEIQGRLGTGSGVISCILVNGQIIVSGTDK